MRRSRGRRSTATLREDLHALGSSSRLVATYQVYRYSWIDRRCEVSPRQREGCACPPGVGTGVVYLHDVARVGGYSPSSQYPYLPCLHYGMRLGGHRG